MQGRHHLGMVPGQPVRYRITGGCGVEDSIDDKLLVAQPKRPQFVRDPRRLTHGTTIRPCHQNDGGRRRIAQRFQGGAEAFLLHLQPGTRTKTGRASVIALKKSRSRLVAG